MNTLLRRVGACHRLLLTAVLAVSSTTASALPAAADPGGTGPVPAEVDRFLSDFVDESGVPGVSVAITKGTEVVYVTGAGHGSDGEPVTADTLMRVASLSKSFTALAVMQLVEEGKVDLDRPVRTYLPEFTLDDPRVEDITVRQLLNHTSGMADSEFRDEHRVGPDTLEEYVAGMADVGLAAEPGSRYSYHNPNFRVAARLVEVVGGEPIDEYLARRVFAPLGMESSLMIITGDQPVPGLPDGHVWAYGRALPAPDRGHVQAGAGGVVTTARDMARWLIMQNNGGESAEGTPIVSAGSIAEMHRPQGPGDEPEDGHGLGWAKKPPADGKGPVRVSHGGAGRTYGSYQGLFTESGGYGIAVMINSGLGLDVPQPSDVVEGLTPILGIEEPRPYDHPPMLTQDLVLTLLAVLSAGLGAWGALRSGRWARRRAAGPWWRTVLGLLPSAAVITVVLWTPAYLSDLFGGRTVTWSHIVFGAPVLAAWCAAMGLSAVLVTVVRGMRLLRILRSPDPGEDAR
ncbi:serine hydrolase domain-containing protein [Nocardiopsis chromatogenes]|uniref:serine hydrolase domain-containing protein n=1 Tax=Nocardiopsis chromatogenes TaxID=280239 RepID=UPI000476FADB|nr:serine hydrolase domain-containing protein [Nocardiopsis chromatogenes]